MTQTIRQPLASIMTCAAALLAAQAAHAQSTPQQSSDVYTVDEVIVTATKRPEAVRDISGSVAAYSGEQLEALGAQSMEDYVTRMPGVVFNQETPGDSTVTVRGISTGSNPGQGTTGYFINDVPLNDPGFTIGTPDIDTFDVDNVAVLRGPQGTLFGSGSLGGAVNYQAARPDLTGFDMKLQGTVEGVQDGDVGHSERVMVNVPLSDTFAVRGVYSNREIAGFIDNIGTGADDANSTRVEGGRFQALWRPRESTSLNYLYLNQTIENADSYGEAIALGSRQRSTVVPETTDFSTEIHNLRLDQDLGIGTLTAMATYHRKENTTLQDVSDPASGIPNLGGVGPITVVQGAEAEGTTYEVRLASPSGGRVDYLIGLMHDETDQVVDQFISDPGSAATVDFLFGPGAGALLAPNDRTLTVHLPFRSEETALFGELTYHFSDAWKATVGGRAFRQEVSSENSSSGVIALILTGSAASTFVAPPAEEDGFNPKFSLTWTPNEDFMAYALVSKGFRIGGPNVTPSLPGQPVPLTFESDSLINYEAGFRADLADGRLLLDVTGFYIDWDNIQLQRSTSQSFTFGLNAGAAEVLGVEASTTFHVTEALTLRSAVTYMDATLAAEIPGYPPLPAAPVQPPIPAGSRLPGSSEWMVSNVLSYEWSAGAFEPSFVLSHRFVSEAPSTIGSGQVEGDYNIFDARFRFEWDRVGVSAYLNNIGDERGVVQADTAERTYTRPRTIGITLDYRL